MSHLIALFSTTRNAMKAQKLCKQSGLTCRTIPVPKDLSSECGIALEFDFSDDQKVKKLFNEERIEADFHYAS